MEYKYDAENHVVAAGINFITNNTAPTSQYFYDAAGKRTRKLVIGVETWFVYGIDGELVAEYNANAAVGSPQKEYGYRSGQLLVVYDNTETVADKKLQWMVADHLGTPRMVIDKTGSLSGIKRHDYLPFGEEVGANVGIRSVGNGFTADQIKQKFTGHERDIETGLDFMQARYFSNTQGRFTSPDLPFADQNQIEPQSWNLYRYGANNPLRYSDPTGRGVLDRIRNAWNGYGFITDAQRVEKTAQKREELQTWVDSPTETNVIRDNRNGGERSPNDLTEKEVWGMHAELKAKNIGTFVTPDLEVTIPVPGGQTADPIGPRKPDINFSQSQLTKKFAKHAKDFGVIGRGSGNKETLAKWVGAMEQHVADPATKVIQGTYKQIPVTHYVNPNTGLNVIKDAAGNFVSGWKLGAAQLQNVLARGAL